MAANLSERLLQRQLERAAKHGGIAPAAGHLSGAGHAALLVVSALIVGVGLLLGVVGLWLLVSFFPAPAAWLGLILLAIVVVARPRLGRVPRRAVPLESLPQLAALCSEVAVVLGARRPDVVVFMPGTDWSIEPRGVRRRVVLVVGVARWCGLEPQTRVAALAAEMARGRHGDPLTSTLVAGAVSTSDGWYDALTVEPTRTARQPGPGPLQSAEPYLHHGRQRGAGGVQLGQLLAGLLMAVPRLIPRLGGELLARLSWRQRLHATWRADLATVDLAGVDAAMMALVAPASEAVLTNVVARVQNGFHRDDDLVDVVAAAMARMRELPRQQLRERLADGPTAVMDLARFDAIVACPGAVPTVRLLDSTSAAIDAEMAGYRRSATAALRSGASTPHGLVP